MQNNHLPRVIAAEPFHLKGSRLIAARIANESIHDVSWDAIVAVAYERAYKHFKYQGLKDLEIIDKLWKEARYEVKPGEYNDGSSFYHARIHASVQSRDADQAMTIVLRLAQVTGESFEITLRLPRSAPTHAGRVVIIWWDHTADDKHLDELLGITSQTS